MNSLPTRESSTIKLPDGDAAALVRLRLALERHRRLAAAQADAVPGRLGGRRAMSADEDAKRRQRRPRITGLQAPPKEPVDQPGPPPSAPATD